jgi:hypothetical protein
MQQRHELELLVKLDDFLLVKACFRSSTTLNQSSKSPTDVLVARSSADQRSASVVHLYRT